MPFRAFEVARAQAQDEAIEFSLAGQAFRCRTSPSLGDTFELMEAPEPAPETEAQAALALAKFIRRLLATEEDQERWDALLYELGTEALPPIIDLGHWLVEQVTGHPSKPPASSSGGRRPPGRKRKPRSAGRSR